MKQTKLSFILLLLISQSVFAGHSDDEKHEKRQLENKTEPKPKKRKETPKTTQADPAPANPILHQQDFAQPPTLFQFLQQRQRDAQPIQHIPAAPTNPIPQLGAQPTFMQQSHHLNPIQIVEFRRTLQLFTNVIQLNVPFKAAINAIYPAIIQTPPPNTPKARATDPTMLRQTEIRHNAQQKNPQQLQQIPILPQPKAVQAAPIQPAPAPAVPIQPQPTPILRYDSLRLTEELKQILFVYDSINNNVDKQQYIIESFTKSNFLKDYKKDTTAIMNIEAAEDYPEIAEQLKSYRNQIQQHLKGVALQDMTKYLTCMIYLSKYNIFASYLAYFMSRETSDFIYNLTKILPKELLDTDPYIKEKIHFIFHPKIDADTIPMQERFIHIAQAFIRAYDTIFKIANKSSHLHPILLNILYVRIKDLICFEAKKESIDTFIQNINHLLDIESDTTPIAESIKNPVFTQKLYKQFEIIKDIYIFSDESCAKNKLTLSNLMKFQDTYKEHDHQKIGLCAMGNPNRTINPDYLSLNPTELDFIFGTLKEAQSKKEEKILQNKLIDILITLIDFNKDASIDDEENLKCFIIATILKYLLNGDVVEEDQINSTLDMLELKEILHCENIKMVKTMLKEPSSED
ncbi:MAG: hypothetical protein Q8S31_01020 [Alphaproteobacteria bacterium]|nr:hypothetical protein [Alphaproteobacteria bacterium]